MKTTFLLVLVGFATVHLSYGFSERWSEFSRCILDDPLKGCGEGMKYRQCLNCVNARNETQKCNKLCFGKNGYGHGIPIKSILAKLINTNQGKFSDWSEWTDCSGSCGTGVRKQTRECLQTSCEGDTENTELCSDVDCQLENCDEVPNGDYDINFQDCDINHNICGNWTWGENKWVIGPSRGQTKGTGPNHDTTFEKSCGKYIHFEASVNHEGKFRMKDAVSTTATSCLSFNLNMYSTRPADVGSLVVMVEGSENTLFNRSGGTASRKQGWEPIKINVPKGNNIKIVFKATKGIGSRSDIALDDITFKHDEACTTGVDGNWGSWEEWSDCSPTCGFAESSRHRYCDSPPHTNDGLPCYGNNKETKRCEELEPCPVDGSWVEWHNWSKCTLTCGMESSRRFRTCKGQVGEGKYCLVPGTDKRQDFQMESKECNIKPCPDTWSSWTPYTDCSSTCSDMPGTKYKTRRCKIAEDSDNSMCVPENGNNVKRTDNLVVEYESRVCYAAARYGTCIPDAVTTTAAPALTYAWSDWSETIFAEGAFFQMRVCNGSAADVMCDPSTDEDVVSSDENVEILKVEASCGDDWEVLISPTGEITCWIVSNGTEKLTFTDASSECTERGGEIASIISSEEHRFVVSLLPYYIASAGLYSVEECGTNNNCNYWLGAIPIETNLEWKWFDETLLGYSHFDRNYLDTSGDGIIMNIQTNYSWTKLQTSEERGYVCKKYITPRRVCKDGWYRLGDNCYAMSLDNATATDQEFWSAQSICEETIVGDEHANLASVTNRDIQVFIEKYQNLSSITKMHLGAYSVSLGMALWLDGTYWSPFRFYEGVPLDGIIGVDEDDSEVAQSFVSTWEWEDPGTPLPYICGYSLVLQPKCPNGWERYLGPDGKECYLLVEENAPYHTDAIKGCETRGAVLARTIAYYEQAFALDVVRRLNNGGGPVAIGTTIPYELSTHYFLDGVSPYVRGFVGEDFSTLEETICIKDDGTDYETCNIHTPKRYLCRMRPNASAYKANPEEEYGSD